MLLLYYFSRILRVVIITNSYLHSHSFSIRKRFLFMSYHIRYDEVVKYSHQEHKPSNISKHEN